LIVVEQLSEASLRIDAEVFVALRADIKIVFKIFFPDNLPAVVTLHPQTLGAHLFLARSVKLAGLSFKPSHKKQWSVIVRRWFYGCRY
jgi:hypothetical protein